MPMLEKMRNSIDFPLHFIILRILLQMDAEHAPRSAASRMTSIAQTSRSIILDALQQFISSLRFGRLYGRNEVRILWLTQCSMSARKPFRTSTPLRRCPRPLPFNLRGMFP
ncbi:hypothetical protein ACQQ2N_18925 [Dokdonella sp. MW10]|uniref:hypothetical protein n=1 Tax=Dokdonella sp. MW10 TaxID=2992926 RepID=UPI003F7F2D06